jgi:hypothetical protein
LQNGIVGNSPVLHPVGWEIAEFATLRAPRLLSIDTKNWIDRKGSKVMEQGPDWRYENAKKFDGAVLSWCLYKSPRVDWDHDHCEGCWQKFAEVSDPPEILNAGYKTDDDNWVCPECFSDLKDQLHWTVVGDVPHSP